MNAPLPVSIVGGFLGAGKTTLVRRVLAEPHGLRITVLVNDFGELDIDRALIAERRGNVISLVNGCICCSVHGDLVGELARLAAEAARQPDHVLIETSGLSDPGPVARAIGYPELRGRLALATVVVLVDTAAYAGLGADARRLVEVQIGAADLVALNKIDLGCEAAEGLRAEWAASGTRFIETRHADLPLAAVLAAHDGLVRAPGVAASVTAPLQACSWAFVCDRPLGLEALRHCLAALPPAVFRAKGFAYLAEAREIECVVNLVGPRVELSRGAAWQHAPATRLQFIALAPAFDWSGLRDALAATVADAH